MFSVENILVCNKCWDIKVCDPLKICLSKELIRRDILAVLCLVTVHLSDF